MGATFEAFLLRIAEMIEAQAERAGTIVEAHQQAAAFAHGNVGAGNRAFNHCILTGAQRADWHDARAILITQRQVKQHILKVFQTDLGELLLHGRANTFKCSYGNRCQLGHCLYALRLCA